MPTVQYQPDQVRTQVAGTTQARAVDNGGQQLAQGINSIAQAANQLEKQATVAEAQQASTSFERDKNNLFFDPENGYFNTTGRDAYEKGEGVSKELEALREQYSSSLNPRARQEFERVANAQITRANADVMRHSSTNLKAWEQSNIQAEVENSLENGALYWNNIKSLNVERFKGREAVRESAQMQGLSPQATNEKLQTYDSAFAMNIIGAAANKSPADGEQAMKLWGEQLEGPDKVKMDGVLTTKRRVQDTRDKANLAVSTANNLVLTYGDRPDARAAMIEEVNKIEDPEEQKMVKAEASYQLDQKLRADSEERANIVTQAQEAIYFQGQSVEGFKRDNAEAWDKLRPTDKAALGKGTPIKTDYIAFGELKLLNDKDLAKVDPADYRAKLANTEYKELVTLVKSARGEISDRASSFASVQSGRSRTAQTTSTVEQLFGKKSSWNDKEKARVNVFYGAIDGEVRRLEGAKGDDLSSKEYTDVLYEFTRKHVIEGFIFNSEYDVSDIPAADLKMATEYLNQKNIPATVDNIFKADADIKVVTEYLNQNKIPATVSNIIKAYEQAQQ